MSNTLLAVEVSLILAKLRKMDQSPYHEFMVPVEEDGAHRTSATIVPRWVDNISAATFLSSGHITHKSWYGARPCPAQPADRIEYPPARLPARPAGKRAKSQGLGLGGPSPALLLVACLYGS